MIKNYEVRNDGEVCIKPESRTIEGHAAIFNRWSNPLMGIVNSRSVLFREMILPGAFDGLIDTQDVTANFNHEDENGVLARSKRGIGSLSLSVDEIGLRYSFECPETTLGCDMMESLKRGDIDSSSFAFSVAKDGDKWDKNTDGTYNRSISKISKLYDVSMVVRPAYEGAGVQLRSLEAIEEIETREQELENYYTQLKSEYV